MNNAPTLPATIGADDHSSALATLVASITPALSETDKMFIAFNSHRSLYTVKRYLNGECPDPLVTEKMYNVIREYIASGRSKKIKTNK